ncbi:hypothetical protein BY996DRAFT_7234526, partial [Phakopsora pachyrhizi]
SLYSDPHGGTSFMSTGIVAAMSFGQTNILTACESLINQHRYLHQIYRDRILCIFIIVCMWQPGLAETSIRQVVYNDPSAPLS